MPEDIDSKAGVEFFSGLLVPAMVNAHCHLELSYMKGKILTGSGFAGFADGMSSHRGESTLEERVAAVAYQDSKMYSEGITAVGDVCNGTSTFDTKKRSKIYYHNFIELFGLKAIDCSPIKSVIESAKTANLPFSPTPHSTYSLQDLPFRQVSMEAYESGKPLSIHFMESRGEEELFKGYGALHDRNIREHLTIDFTGYGSPTERIIGSIPHGAKLLLIHNTFITKEDIEKLIAHFGRENLTFVLCPRSNRYIENNLPPVTMLYENDVRIAIGTDSLASNESLSLIEELKLIATISQNKIPLYEMLKWATINGASALGADKWAGSFECGKRPGAVLITNIDWDNMRLTSDSKCKRII